MKEEILGSSYELSVAIVGKEESHKFNKEYREKDKPTNVLSFPLTETSGELILDVETATEEAPSFDMDRDTFLKYLVIHGMLHLKGYDHGSTMEKEEERLLKLF